VLLDKRLSCSHKVRSFKLYGFIVVALVGLVVAYSAGSSTYRGTTIAVIAFVAIVLICVVVQAAFVQHFKDAVKNSYVWQQLESVHGALSDASHHGAVSEEHSRGLEKARSLVLLLATLAATNTFKAGLSPPGGLWQEDGAGYKAGDPVLLTTNLTRYKIFFYCNSVAFVASLVVIVLVRRKTLHQHNALEFATVPDLIGCVGAYTTGSCHDVGTSIHAVRLGGVVLVYVVFHITLFTMGHHRNDDTSSSEAAVVALDRGLYNFFLIHIESPYANIMLLKIEK
jgi:hypothetical protein